MIKTFNPSKQQQLDLIKRPMQNLDSLLELVQSIFDEVRLTGDIALAKYTELFDKARLKDIEVNEDEIATAGEKVPENLKVAIQLAKRNIESFHAAQRFSKIEVETTEGVLCWQEKRPIQKVGLYIPGGSAALFSTVLMLAIPAKLAGCEDIILCSPPQVDGNISPAIIYTAKLCGVSRIFKVGGIQAIAAMTFGTNKISRVYKIFGPGNQYVTAAKQLAIKYGVAIDMPAGPSELLIVADDSAIPEFVASDLLSQAEHGADSHVILVSSSLKIIEGVEAEIEKQLQSMPREAIAQESLKKSQLIYMSDDQSILDFINDYAPEHLIIVTKNENFFSDNIQNAGSVFIGNYTPESAGDYASGTNHTLPTNGYARNHSGVGLDSFQKAISFQRITETGLRNIGNAIEIMADAEGLYAHKNAVTLRLNSINNTKR